VLPEDFQDKKKNTNVALKLHELGPRLRLRLVKIEEGVCRGNVVFHAFIKKSKAEVKKQMDSLKNKRELKAERKRIQEENVKKKQMLQEQKTGGKGVSFKTEGDRKEKEEEEYPDVDIDEAPKKIVLGKRKINLRSK
jgi:ribosome biogenesis protein SSF1/2